jgi:hypothetical protein
MTVPSGETYVGPVNVDMQIGDLHTLAKKTIGDQINELVDALDVIGKTLDGLEVSWAGDAKNKAQQLLDRWTRVSDSIFGTKTKPEKGVLARLAGGVQNASFAYNQTETVVRESWAKLRVDLETILAGGSPPSGSDDGQDAPPISEV